MRMLETSPDLDDVTHLILDEVHERSIDSDFLLIVVKKLLVRRRNLKFVCPLAFDPSLLMLLELFSCQPQSMLRSSRNT